MRNWVLPLLPVGAVSYFVLFPNDLFTAISWMMDFIRYPREAAAVGLFPAPARSAPIGIFIKITEV